MRHDLSTVRYIDSSVAGYVCNLGRQFTYLQNQHPALDLMARIDINTQAQMYYQVFRVTSRKMMLSASIKSYLKQPLNQHLFIIIYLNRHPSILISNKDVEIRKDVRESMDGHLLSFLIRLGTALECSQVLLLGHFIRDEGKSRLDKVCKLGERECCLLSLREHREVLARSDRAEKAG